MFRSKRLPMAVALVALAAIPAAFPASAQSTSQSGGHENGREATVASAAKVSPQQAIAAAEKSAGGHARRIEIKQEKGADLYRIKVMTNDAVAIVKVDATSGQIAAVEKPSLVERVFDREDKSETAKLQNARTSLSAAIDAAEKQTGGKTVEAGVENEDGHLAYEVETVKGNANQRVRVDIDTGQVVIAQEDED